MTLDNIKAIWEKDKGTFKLKELGGLQTLVADIFECTELFGLKRGLESTKDAKRQKEFVVEKNKNGRRADIVIFYKGDEIVVPVEIEKYENIEAGVHQLENYQNDYQKAYGILTDGYRWRFYNNTKYREFVIDDFFSRPSEIKTFWEDYIKEDNYYLNFFSSDNDDGNFLENAIKVDEYRTLFFEDITHLIQRFKDKLGIVGYLKERGTADSDKRATEIAYAYFIQFILYKNLVDNCYAKFDKEFKDRIKNIHTALRNKLYASIASQIYGISSFISDRLYKPFNKEQAFINIKLLELVGRPMANLDDVSLWLDIIVFIKKYNFANLRNEIFGFIYENYLKEMYQDIDLGQYFTDPTVVNFMLDEIGYTSENIKKLYNSGHTERLSIIDPSCGSGTFLYSAADRIITTLFEFDCTEKMAKDVEKIINENVFGLDIAEFPLYLAEMNILMRMLPVVINENYTNPIDKKIKVFKTRDSITEFMDTGIVGKINLGVDEETGQNLLFKPEVLELSYDSFIRDEDDLKEMKTSMRPPRRRFDYVIGNPPYIGYNECCKQNVLFTKQIKDKKLSMSNIYGVNLHSVPGNPKKRGPKPNLYAFFIALGGGLLKPGGKMCYIVPQTLLSSIDLDVIRYYLSNELTIDKIITFDGRLFIHRGLDTQKAISTSSLILVVRKTKLIADTEKRAHQIIIENYVKKNEDIASILKSNYKFKRKKKVLQKEAEDTVENWNYFMASDETIDFIDKYKEASVEINPYDRSMMYDKGFAFYKAECTNDATGWATIKKVKNNYNIGLSGSYIANDKITVPQGSQGYCVFDKKYKIIWQYQNMDRFYFSDKKIMVDYNWVVISSDDLDKTILMYAILNSQLSKFVLKYYLKLKNEQSLNVGIIAIKQFIRMPLCYENAIMQEIIKQTKMLLTLEDCRLKDVVDFSNITIQQFSQYNLNTKTLTLFVNDVKVCDLRIMKPELLKQIKNTLEKLWKRKRNTVSLLELKSAQVIDDYAQERIKKYVDDLVFALYFGVEISELGYGYREIINEACLKNKYYLVMQGEIENQ